MVQLTKLVIAIAALVVAPILALPTAETSANETALEKRSQVLHCYNSGATSNRAPVSAISCAVATLADLDIPLDHQRNYLFLQQSSRCSGPRQYCGLRPAIRLQLPHSRAHRH